MRLRHLLPLALLLLVPISWHRQVRQNRRRSRSSRFCVQNATTATPTPTCGPAATSVFAGNSVATVQLSVTNDGTSTTAIQSADIVVPPQLKVDTSTTAPQPTSNVTASGQHIRIQNVKVQAGRSFVATFKVDVACGGQFDWSGSQSAFASSDLTGTSFTYQSAASTGVSTSITTACHLGFVGQPTDTQSGSEDRRRRRIAGWPGDGRSLQQR